jgi:plasmid maintenance system antidote protein VapI
LRTVTTSLLDEVLEAKGVVSDYALAKLLQVRQQTISNYRNGRSQMSDVIAMRVARMMGRSPAPILIQLAAQRAKDSEVAKVWKELAKVLARKSR